MKFIKKIKENHKKVIVIIAGFLAFVYLVFIQYNYFAYDKKIKDINKEIVSIGEKLKDLNDKKALLDSTLNTNSKELDDLQAELLKLQGDLDAANKKLDELK